MDDFTQFSIVLISALVLLAIVAAAIKIVQQYEHGVVFRFGKVIGLRLPGFNMIIPLVDRMIKVDLRTVTMIVEPQEVITRDNVTIRVDAVVYFSVVRAQDAVIKVQDYNRATTQVALTTLRSVLGQSDLDEVPAHREQINERLREIIDEQTEPWGVKVTLVEVKDVLLPEAMQRAMAKQAEAEREKRAKVIHADGEYQAAEKLAGAARIISAEPTALELRYLQTLTEIAGERNSTIIPLPIDIMGAVTRSLSGRDGESAPAAGAPSPMR